MLEWGPRSLGKQAVEDGGLEKGWRCLPTSGAVCVQRFGAMAEHRRYASWVPRPVQTALVQNHAFQMVF